MAKIKTYTIKKQPKETEKFGSHDTAILKALNKAGGTLTRDKLITQVEKLLEGKTVQPAARIVSYQIPLLAERGLVKVTEAEDETKPVPKANKAPKAKAKKAGKGSVAETNTVLEPAAETTEAFDVTE